MAEGQQATAGTLHVATRRRVLKMAAGIGAATSISSARAISSQAPGGEERWHIDGVWVPSQTVVDGVAYYDASNQAKGLTAVDAATGDRLWQRTDGSPPPRAPTVVSGTAFYDLNHPHRVAAVGTDRGTLAWETSAFDTADTHVADGVMYAWGAEGSLAAYDAATGTEKWRTRPYDPEVSDTYRAVRNSLTVADGTVYAGDPAGVLHAIDAASGQQRWNFEADRPLYASPTVVDDTVYIASMGARMYALDAADGSERWRIRFHSTRSSPTVRNGKVFAGSEAGIHALAADTGAQQWEFNPDDGVLSSPTVAGDTVFVGSQDGRLYALDVTTGERQWQFETGGEVNSAPLVVDGTVYFGTGWPGTSDQEFRLYAVSAGIRGSSSGSRARLGTHGHHDDWLYADQQVDVEVGTPTSQTTGSSQQTMTSTTMDQDKENEDESGSEEDSFDGESGVQVPGFGVGMGVVGLAGGGYLLGRATDSDSVED